MTMVSGNPILEAKGETVYQAGQKLRLKGLKRFSIGLVRVTATALRLDFHLPEIGSSLIPFRDEVWTDDE